MASVHFSVTMAKRSKGHSAVAASAYITGKKLTDERTGIIHDYRQKNGVADSAVLAPAGSPGWVKDPAKLWNRAEAADVRRNSQPARQIVIGLHTELTPEQNAKLIKEFVRDEIVKKHGMVAQLAMHDVTKDNPHAHIEMPTRRAEGDGFGKVERKWQSNKLVEDWRERWAHHSNRHLKMAGSDVRIDMRSYEKQGIDKTPGKHLSRDVYHMKKRSSQLGDKITRLQQADQQPKPKTQKDYRDSIRADRSRTAPTSTTRPGKGPQLGFG